MQGISNLGVNTQNYQTTFRAKRVNKKKAYKMIDKMNETAIDFLNKDRPTAEKRETAIRRSLRELKEYILCKQAIDTAVADGTINPEKARGLLNKIAFEISKRNIK